jgi:hypothetical protein
MAMHVWSNASGSFCKCNRIACATSANCHGVMCSTAPYGRDGDCLRRPNAMRSTARRNGERRHAPRSGTIGANAACAHGRTFRDAPAVAQICVDQSGGGLTCDHFGHCVVPMWTIPPRNHARQFVNKSLPKLFFDFFVRPRFFNVLLINGPHDASIERRHGMVRPVRREPRK